MRTRKKIGWGLLATGIALFICACIVERSAVDSPVALFDPVSAEDAANTARRGNVDWQERFLPVPKLTGRVVDRANIFTEAQTQFLEEEIRQLEARSGGGQMAVLMVRTLKGEPIESFSLRVAETWKIGRKGKDDGALLVVAVSDRQMRLEIGYGWEGLVNDARAGDIVRAMGPYFRAKDYAGGILMAIRSVRGWVTGSTPEKAPDPMQKDAPDSAKDAFDLFDYLFSASILSLLAGWKLCFGFGFLFRGFSGGRGGYYRGGGGGYSGGFFSGGGGSFGGGGASSRW